MNFLWDILRLPSSRRAALGLYVNLTLWRTRVANQLPYAFLHIGARCTAHYAAVPCSETWGGGENMRGKIPPSQKLAPYSPNRFSSEEQWMIIALGKGMNSWNKKESVCNTDYLTREQLMFCFIWEFHLCHHVELRCFIISHFCHWYLNTGQIPVRGLRFSFNDFIMPLQRR